VAVPDREGAGGDVVIRCSSCKRFTRNNVATVGFDTIKAAHGDCSRCGPKVEVDFDAWEDWGWSEEDERAMEDRLIASMEASNG
jgi:hypothetical protein